VEHFFSFFGVFNRADRADYDISKQYSLVVLYVFLEIGHVFNPENKFGKPIYRVRKNAARYQQS